MSDITPNEPRPAVCPACGLTSSNGTVRRSEQVAVATFVCTAGHLFTLTWVEVA